MAYQYHRITEARQHVQQLKDEIEDAKKSAGELNRLLTTYVALARKVGLPPEIVDMIAKAQQARIAVQTLIRTIHILYTTSGPIGWLLGLGGLAVSGFMIADLIDIERRTH